MRGCYSLDSIRVFLCVTIALLLSHTYTERDGSKAMSLNASIPSTLIVTQLFLRTCSYSTMHGERGATGISSSAGVQGFQCKAQMYHLPCTDDIRSWKLLRFSWQVPN